MNARTVGLAGGLLEGAPLRLAVETLDRVGRVQLGPMLRREGHIGEYIGLGLVQEGGELGQLGRSRSEVESPPIKTALRIWPRSNTTSLLLSRLHVRAEALALRLLLTRSSLFEGRTP
jgi:hypothetical protein